MTTLPHTLLSEQEICDAFLEAKAVQPTLAQELRIGRTIESKAIAAYAAKLAQGVELEGFRLTWHSDQARYTVSKPNIDTMDVVPVSTAQAAVAAAILQEREALNDEAADMVVRLQDEKEAAVAAERVKTQAAVNTLQTIAEMPIPEQDNMVAANMRRVAQSMFVQPIAASPAPAAEPAPADRAGLVEECKLRVRAVRDESWHSAHGAQGVNVGQRLDEAFAAIDRIASSAAQVPEDVREALQDALNGWRYIRSTHGDLYGVGWDRVEDKLSRALEQGCCAAMAAAPAAGGDQ